MYREGRPAPLRASRRPMRGQRLKNNFLGAAVVDTHPPHASSKRGGGGGGGGMEDGVLDFVLAQVPVGGARGGL